MLKNYAHRVTSSDLKYTTFKISGFFTNLATGKGSKEYDELIHFWVGRLIKNITNMKMIEYKNDDKLTRNC